MALFANVSIDLTKFKEELSKNPHHSAFTKHDNGRLYANITIWHNDEFDKYGNNVSIQLNSKQEQRASEGKVYVGNGKRSAPQSHPPAQNYQAPTTANTEDDLPF
jgi:hypothetical protein